MLPVAAHDDDVPIDDDYVGQASPCSVQFCDDDDDDVPIDDMLVKPIHVPCRYSVQCTCPDAQPDARPDARGRERASANRLVLRAWAVSVSTSVLGAVTR